MKKFLTNAKNVLSKKCTFIVSVVASAVLLATLLVMAICPTFYAGAYKNVEIYGDATHTSLITYESCSKAKIRFIEEVKGEYRYDEANVMWIYREGKKVIILGEVADIKEEDYKIEVKRLKNLTDAEFEAYFIAEKKGGNAFESSACKISIGEEVAKNCAAGALIAINVILMALAMMAAGLSTYFVFANKTKETKAESAIEIEDKPEEVQEIAETKTEETTEDIKEEKSE